MNRFVGWRSLFDVYCVFYCKKETPKPDVLDASFVANLAHHTIIDGQEKGDRRELMEGLEEGGGERQSLPLPCINYELDKSVRSYNNNKNKNIFHIYTYPGNLQ